MVQVVQRQLVLQGCNATSKGEAAVRLACAVAVLGAGPRLLGHSGMAAAHRPRGPPAGLHNPEPLPATARPRTWSMRSRVQVGPACSGSLRLRAAAARRTSRRCSANSRRPRAARAAAGRLSLASHSGSAAPVMESVASRSIVSMAAPKASRRAAMPSRDRLPAAAGGKGGGWQEEDVHGDGRQAVSRRPVLFGFSAREQAAELLKMCSLPRRAAHPQIR